MDLYTLLMYFQTPVASYTILLAIILTLVFAVNSYINGGWNKSVERREISARWLGIALSAYLVLVLLLTGLNEIALFPVLHAVALGAVLLILILLRPKSSAKAGMLLCIVFVVSMTPVIVMVSAKHPYPLGDDARFPGFAMAININGRWIPYKYQWIPYKYQENPYYQFFHLIPVVEYILASVTGVGLLSVATYYLTLKLCLYITYFTFIYLLMRRLVKGYVTPFMAVLLLSITPPLALAQVVHQAYGKVLFLITAFLVLKRFREIGDQTGVYIIAISMLGVAGVLAHATYTLMIVAFILPLLPLIKLKGPRNNIIISMILLTVMSLTYWIYTYVLDTIVRPGVDAVMRLVDLLTGKTISFSGREPWYTPETSMFFIAWALVPSIVSSHILLLIPQTLRSRSLIPRFKSYTNVLGLLGLGGTVFNYILRSLSTFGGRYFYWFYLLMLPLSAITMEKHCKRLISLLFSAALISLTSFYGIQDPTLSANTYGNYIAWADRMSWHIGLSLAPHLNTDILSWFDARIGAPLSTLAPSTYVPSSSTQILVVLGVDNVGLHATYKDPRNEGFFKQRLNINPKDLSDCPNNFNTIYRDVLYCGILKP